MIRARISQRPLAVLDFDIETRRIGFHNAGRFNPDGCEPVAIAVSWLGTDEVQVWRRPKLKLRTLLANFRRLWDEADMVTGHYIRKFDIPIINGQLLEQNLPLLTEMWTQDTKGDLKDMAGLSQSQENLAEMFRIGSKKFHMNDYMWRGVARLEPAFMDACEERVSSDIHQHKALRETLLKRDAMRERKLWRP